MWYSVKIIEHCKPKFVIWENVKNVLSPRHRHNFDKYLNRLDELGYNNYYEVLNSKDYGIPQSRERLYVLSISKDIDTGTFKFPQPIELKLRLKDIMDEEVDNKFYITADRLLRRTNDNADSGIKQVAQMYATDKAPNPSTGRIYDSSGISPTIDTCGGGNRMVKILEKSNIRKLTPIEYWRLMGFDDEDFYKAAKICSNTQLYKQAGNSIVVNVLKHIYAELQKSNPEFKNRLSVISLFSGIGAFEKALGEFDA